MPLRHTRLIHRRFQAHHQRTVRGQMTAECVITRPSTTPVGPTFDELAGRPTYPDPTTVYSGPCRVARSPRVTAKRETAGDRDVTVREYLVTLPADAAQAQVNDQVTVTAGADDPLLAGQTLRVRDPRWGSVLWQRDLLCEVYPPTTR